MKDPYVRVSPFPVFDINGETTPLMLDFVVYDENPDSRKPKDYIKIKEERKYLSSISPSTTMELNFCAGSPCGVVSAEKT